MRSSPQTKHLHPASLRTSRGARSVLLRMAADQERADRIRALKQERPDLTWRRIAEYVGVTERSATDWQKKGGIDYDNAKKLAEIFEVDVDYVWRGTPEEDRAPSPFAGQDALSDRLAAIEDRLDRMEKLLVGGIDRLDGLEGMMLEGLDKLERALNERAAEHAGEIVAGIVDAVETGQLQVPARSSRTRAAKTAPKRTRAA